jgi:hypothetical protein
MTSPPPPDFVCWIAFVTSSEVSKVAASESIPGSLDKVRVINALVLETCRGLPGMVSDPSTAGHWVPDTGKPARHAAESHAAAVGSLAPHL